MDSLIELHAEGAWHPAARMTTSARGLRFEYLTDYVFGTGTWPVALSLPVDMTIVSTPLDAPVTPLAFLWALVPQGRGRQLGRPPCRARVWPSVEPRVGPV